MADAPRVPRDPTTYLKWGGVAGVIGVVLLLLGLWPVAVVVLVLAATWLTVGLWRLRKVRRWLIARGVDPNG